MRRFLAGVSLIACSFSGAFAQSPARPEFEVASIKPAQQSNDGRIMVRMGGDPGRIDYINITLRDLIRRAYDVKDYQISGPDWMNQQRFDVKATHPPNTPREQVALMLQKLLEDRFKMVIHKEKKQLPAYALTEAKGGFKLKPMSEEEVAALRPPTPPGGGGAVAFGGGRGGPGGGPIPGGGGRMMISLGPGSRRIEAEAMTISGFADMLANQTGRPVVDTTGIQGSYKIKLEFTPDENTPGPRGMPMMMAGPPPGAGAGGGSPAESKAAMERLHAEGAAEAPSLMVVLQEQLGLKLESRKEPLDVIVVEKAERVPTEN